MYNPTAFMTIRVVHIVIGAICTILFSIAFLYEVCMIAFFFSEIISGFSGLRFRNVEVNLIGSHL